MSSIQEEVKPPAAGDNYIHGYTVLAKSMMGAGLLGIACACSNLGWVLGISFGIFIPIISTITLSLLARVMVANPLPSKPTTFYKLTRLTLGKTPSYLIETALILKTFGASIVYLQVAGDMISLIIVGSRTPASSLVISQSNISRIVQLALSAIFYPACLLKNISKTFIINTIGICCLIFIVATSFIYFDSAGAATASPAVTSLWPYSIVSVLSKIPVYLFAYCCHQAVFPWIDDLKNPPNISKADKMFTVASITGFLIYAPVMILPFITFGSGVYDNFLRNLPPNDTVTKIAYICAAISVSISFPLQVVPLRNSIMGLLAERDAKVTGEGEKFFRILIATIAVLASLSIAVSGAPLGVMMSITGLVGGNTIVFLAPSWMYWKTMKTRKSALWYCAIGILGFSIALYPLCLVGIIMSATGYS